MPEVNYYLKKPAGNIPGSLIYLQFKYHGRKLVYSFGQKINAADWSREQKRVKSSRQTILDGKYALNELLDRLEKACMKAYTEELTKGIPPVSVLKYRLDNFIRQQEGKKESPRVYEFFDRFIAGEIPPAGKDKSRHTLKNYATTKSHLHGFDIATRYHLNFEKFNLDFFERYTSFLKNELHLRPNSIARDIRILKRVLAEAVRQDYTTNIQFRHPRFHLPDEETDAVWLTEKEIALLARLDLSGNQRLGQVRDLFVSACSTGARLSGQARALSNQKFNSYLKELCQLAGLRQKGRLSTDPGRELWECISSDTARRSTAVNGYRAGTPLPALMKMTGHQTEKAFLRYVHADKPASRHAAIT